MNAHCHDLEISTLLRRSPLQPWVPVQWGRDLAAIRESDDKLGRGELDCIRAEIANVNSKMGIPGSQQLSPMLS